MKALTIQQPFASLIMLGHKRVENREWRTFYRGPLVIHAGLSDDWRTAGEEVLRAAGLAYPHETPQGAILGLVDLVDVREFDAHSLFRDEELAADPFASGPYCWMLENPRPLPRPLPYRGQMGLWTPDPDVLHALEVDLV